MPVRDEYIAPTDKMPEVILRADGFVKIKGRGLTVNRTRASEQIIGWIENYIQDPAETTNVIIAFDYLNSFSAAILVSILKMLARVREKGKKLTVKWYYEDDDDDLLERGRHISSTFRIPIEFIVTDDITGC